MLNDPVLVMIEPYIFVTEALCILILVIILYRILENPFSKIQTAVTVDSPAHQIVNLFFFCFAQICFAIVQLHVSIGFFLHFRSDHCNFASLLAFFFHIFCYGRIFKRRSRIRQLFHIAFQRFFIHLFRKKIFPRIFRKVFHSHCKHSFK